MAFQFFVEDGQGQEVGSVTFAGLPADTETITIFDGVKTAVTFEFDSGGGVTPGNVAVTIGGDAATTATNLATEITAQRTGGFLDVTAVAVASLVTVHNLNIIGGAMTGTPTNTTVVTFSPPTSYVSLDDANTYLTPNIHTTYWDALTDDNKKYLLAFATTFIDDHTRWEGTKTVTNSALRWPRTGVVDRDGQAIGANEIPVQLARATAEMARYLVQQDRTTERAQDGLKELVVDVVELVFNENYRLPTVPSEMNFLLAGLGVISGQGRGTARVLRT